MIARNLFFPNQSLETFFILDIIQVYAPTPNSWDGELESFYKDVRKVIKNVKKNRGK